MRTLLVLTALLLAATSCTKTIHEARAPLPAAPRVAVADVYALR